MPAYLSLKPVLYTKELSETVDFYVKVLGFTCAAFEIEWGWASLIKDDVEIMLAYPNEHISFNRPAFTGSLYINTDDVDALWEEWKDTCRIIYPVENFEYQMREFAIYDNNGYILQFGQSIS